MELGNLILGFTIGVMFVFLLLAQTIFFTNRKFLKNSLNTINITNFDVKDIVEAKQSQIIKSKRLGLGNNFNLVQDLTKEVVMEVAKYYYPDSKCPHLEISLIEALDMNQRVTERLKTMLDNKAIGLIKNIRISQIIALLEIKKNVENNPIYRFSKKYNLDKVIQYGYAALNLANPAYWVRKIISTSTLETTLRGIGVMTISIVGEEAIQLYSKKIIDNRDKILDRELEKYLKEIEMIG
ncbi:MAG: hypothetical protein K0Q49_1163 [Haloplasmataceae bacterium]|jgi:hypothetical protein|nr:hypothetical protein [Haloplasmataceae bacterium]